ncbi:MAG: hypothetical protein V2A71_04470, partial [Candidatus Eisenbacteria bacterium]
FVKEMNMPIVDTVAWKSWEDANKDPYGGCCVNVAREVMRLLDAEPGDFDPHKIICRADDNIRAGGITGFMAGCVAGMVSKCHSRGEEFRRKWNRFNQIGTEGDEANDKGGAVLNPALLSISPKK